MSEATAETEESPPVETYSFDKGFQTKITALSILDSAFMRQTEGLIKPEYLEDASEAVLVSISQEFFEKYRTVPHSTSEWAEALKDARSKKRLRDDLFRATVEKFKKISSEPVTGRDFVVDKCSEFARHQAIQSATLAHIDLIEKGKIDEAQAVMEKAFAIGAANDSITLDYFDDLDRRTEYRRAVASGEIEKSGIKTGIKRLDALLFHGGWGRQELSVIMAGAKKGKSMGLGEFSIRACMQGYNVLYVSLEVGLGIISDRLDANLSNTEMNSLQSHIKEVDGKIKMKASMPGKGILKLAQAASGSLKPSGLKRIIERYRGEGVQFDLIVVDYADIMAPERQMNSEIAESKEIWLALRAIAFAEDAAVLTATQTNREGHKASVAKAEDVAEDFNKIRIADLVISINRDDEETEKGEARLFFAASRNQQDGFSIRITQALAKGQFITSIVGME